MKTLKIKSEVHVGPRTSFSRFSLFKKDVNEGEASAYSAMPNWDTLPWGFLICSLYYSHFSFFFFGRWLVLSFKREFPFEDALTMFEIISSQHLELSSMEAERERERQRAKELERDG